MADQKRKNKDREKADDDDDYFQIRAKGQFLRVPKDLDQEDITLPSGADHMQAPTKRKKKVLSRKEKRKDIRNKKKAKKNEFFHNKGKPEKKDELASTELQVESPNKDSSKKNTKKRKRKKKNSEPSAREIEIQRLKEENEKEDKEIKKLEKLLSMNKKKKLPSQFVADGLDYLLEVCDYDRFDITNRQSSDSEGDQDGDKYDMAFARNKKRKKEEKQSRDSTVKKSTMEEVGNHEEDDDPGDHNISDECDDDFVGDLDGDDANDDDDDDDDDDNEYDDEDDIDEDIVNSDDDGANSNDDDNDDKNISDNEDGNDLDEVESDDDDDDEVVIPSKMLKTERQSTNKQDSEQLLNNKTKYIPPHLRHKGSSDTNKEHFLRIRRQLKGLLNKLSEGNLQFVSNEIEELFVHNSRNDMNELLTEVILDSCVSTSLMPSKLLMEHCLLLAVLNNNIDMEIGAFFVQTLAQQFDKLHKAGEKEGKKIFNVVSLFSHLYNFKVVHCGLIYDVIRCLTAAFQETDIDLLLLVLKSTGAEIRRDDPGSLKDIILELQAKGAAASGLHNDSRVRFMLEIVANLRNNNLRKIPGYDPSQVEHLRKLLRNTARGTSASQLQISLEDLLQAETKGRWWIVGSAWSGRNQSDVGSTSSHQWNSQLLELARKQRMNTDVRRNIFCAMMTSEDYVDAFEKLLRLKLKDIQAREIVHVLLDCCLKEKVYNPFYAYLGQKFCEYNRSYQVTFQFSFWDKFKVIDSLKPNSLNNLSLLLCHLVASKAMSLSVLKAVDFMELDKPSIRFFKDLLMHLLTEYPAEVVRKSFERIATIPDLSHLRQGLALFIRHFLLKKKHDERILGIIDVLQAAKEPRL